MSLGALGSGASPLAPSGAGDREGRLVPPLPTTKAEGAVYTAKSAHYIYGLEGNVNRRMDEYVHVTGGEDCPALGQPTAF